MQRLHNFFLRMMLSCGLSFLCCGAALALSYKDALKAYEAQEYQKCYRISVALVKKVRATERAKLFILAGAAVLELDREPLARGYFRRALFYNPSVQLPSAVRSPRVHRYLADVRSGKLQDPGQGELAEEAEPAFDQPLIYLPLGINQFLQKKWVLGIGFGLAQILPLYYALDNFDSAARVDRLSKQSTAEAIASGDDINPIYIKYISDNDEYAANARRQAQLQILFTLGAYAASVAEAGLRPTAPDIFLSRGLSGLPGLWAWQPRWKLSIGLAPQLEGGAELGLRKQL